MTFEYVIPGETVVKRQFVHNVIEHDTFAVIVAGAIVATVPYDRARAFWLGKVELSELVNNANQT